MNIYTFFGIILPFIGTSIGACSVLFMKNELSQKLEYSLDCFAAGVMTAASVWSLLIPAIDRCITEKSSNILPVPAGFWSGILFMLLFDCTLTKPDRIKSNKTSTMFAVVLHNIPEGLAVGIAFAGLLSMNAPQATTGAFALSFGIAVQNLPEGAIISMPLHAAGHSRTRSLFGGILSGAVEPIAAATALAAAPLLTKLMPFLLSSAAGAMIFVTAKELLPQGKNADTGNALMFAAGFSLMMILDISL